MKVLGTRIYLRLLSPDDVSEAYLQWMHDPEVIQYLESRWQTQTMESVRAFVQDKNDSQNDFLFGIFLNDTHQHIGNIKIGDINFLYRRGDVGLIIGEKSAWGKGYGTDAIELVTQYGFQDLNLHKLTAGMYVPNQGSYKAFIKAGYREVGIYKKHTFVNGQYVDSIIVEKCND
jgi:[ribosomal protein S5]-alanine N-acetyltransferase